jgi:hypothetical protein
MPFVKKILVVANQTAASDDLLAALCAHHERQPTRFTLLVPTPATAPGDESRANLEAALARLRDAGLEVTGTVGFGDPMEVFDEAWDPRSYDEIIVSTLPGQMSKWLQVDLPHRIAGKTGVQVTHVVSMTRAQRAGEALPEHAKPGVLSPLTVLTWGRPGRG